MFDLQKAEMSGDFICVYW